MSEKYIDVNGWRTRYVSAGTQGSALVFLHGLGASLDSWSLNLKPLGETFRVFAPDMIYFGKSAKPKHPPRPTEFISFVLGFMDALGLARATLIGNSMGGAVATRMAITAPERVERLILVDPAGFGRELVWWLRLRTMVDLRARGKPSPRMLRYGLQQVFYNPDRVPQELIEAMVALNAEPGVFESYRRVLRAGVDWRGLKDRMLSEVRDESHRIRVPTLLVWGKQDRVVPLHQMNVAQQKIPHAQTYVFDECGHAPQIEHAAQFNTLVRDFVLTTGEKEFA
jgi:4,5:9,10-diseco-3-hydroxy-5,9,17-trioxoandrosta-1(10),2-diene-4-oate hydrolase